MTYVFRLVAERIKVNRRIEDDRLYVREREKHQMKDSRCELAIDEDFVGAACRVLLEFIDRPAVDFLEECVVFSQELVRKMAVKYDFCTSPPQYRNAGRNLVTNKHVKSLLFVAEVVARENEKGNVQHTKVSENGVALVAAGAREPVTNARHV